MSIISSKYKFVFIHNPKVAGKSIKKALRKYRDYSRLGEGIFFFFDRTIKADYSKVAHFLPRNLLWTPHAKAIEIKRNLPNGTFDRYFKFAFVRNPWDWHISMYHFMKTSQKHPRHREVVNLSGFEDFLEWWIENGVQLQKDFVTDENGEIIVDFIGRFENLLQDFNSTCSRLGITASLPHVNRSNHYDYRKYYNSRTKALIKIHAGEDIELFKYSF